MPVYILKKESFCLDTLIIRKEKEKKENINFFKKSEFNFKNHYRVN